MEFFSKGKLIAVALVLVALALIFRNKRARDLLMGATPPM